MFVNFILREVLQKGFVHVLLIDMNLPDDLKHYRAPDAFQILEESEAAVIFWILLIVAAIVVGI